MGQNVPQIGQNYILMTRIGQKSHYWSEMVQNSQIRCSKHVWIGSKLAKNGQEQDFNKVHLEKWRLGIVTRFKFVTIMYNLCKIT